MSSPVNLKDEVEKANQVAVDRMMESDPFWTDVVPAITAIPGMRDHLLLHAGPPITWERMSGPVKGAVLGACIYEGWAKDDAEAEKLIRSGVVQFEPCHHHDAVGPMAGIISPSMPVFEVTDRKFGLKSYSNFNEGIGKVLRYGAYGEEVLKRLAYIRDSFAPALLAGLKELKKEKPGFAFKPLIAQGLTMGDDCHNRYVATTSLLVRELAQYLVASGGDREEIRKALVFMNANNFTALNLGMASAKAMTMAAHGIKYSTIVTTMARNGTDIGIRVSGLGEEWFTAPAPMVNGLWFPGFTAKDSNPDLGDSSITETAGFGGFAMATAPAIVSWVGGSVAAAVEITKKMYEITYAKHRYFLIPNLDFAGTPTGVDIRKVVKTGITPNINTGVASKEAGVGQVGAGLVVFPMEMFKKALKGYAERYAL
ncbi:MAG: DUF1116 domain-containing protein [Conexivisphaerales archaeon]